MSSLDIKLNIKKLTDCSVPIISKVEKKTLLLMIESFSKYLSRVYVSSIEESMKSPRYKGKWEPTDDNNYKEYIGTEPTTPILDLIRESLEVKKIGYNFVIRINPCVKYPGSQLPLERVVRAIDRGTSKFNARPIFSKIIHEIDIHKIDLWEGYLCKMGVI